MSDYSGTVQSILRQGLRRARRPRFNRSQYNRVHRAFELLRLFALADETGRRQRLVLDWLFYRAWEGELARAKKRGE